jgi:hypothetical protein
MERKIDVSKSDILWHPSKLWEVAVLCLQRGEHSPPFACKVLTPAFGNAFGSSATTGGLLLRCRYVLPPESYFVFNFRGDCGDAFKNKSGKRPGVRTDVLKAHLAGTVLGCGKGARGC